MKINIFIKSPTKRGGLVAPRPFELRDKPKTVGDLLDEAVKTLGSGTRARLLDRPAIG